MDRRFLPIFVGSLCFVLILYQYVAPGVMNLGSPPKNIQKYHFPVRDLDRNINFKMGEQDVIVVLHIQKTGGSTFGRELAQNLRVEVPCKCKPGKKKCTCNQPNHKHQWLFSRLSTGWACGLHADWTELTNCVPGVLDKLEKQQNSKR